jgi:hypothetical protein
MKLYVSIPKKYEKTEIELIKIKGKKRQKIFKIKMEKEESEK